MTHEIDSTYKARLAHTYFRDTSSCHSPLLQIVPGERRTASYNAYDGDDTHRLPEEKPVHRVLRFNDHSGQHSRLSSRHTRSPSDEFHAQLPLYNPAAFHLHNNRNPRMEHRGDSGHIQAWKIRRKEGVTHLSIHEMAAPRDRMHFHVKNRRSLHFFTTGP